MQLSDGEKLIILMLADIYKNMDIRGEIDADFVKSAILDGNLWGIHWEYGGIPFADHETPATCQRGL